MTDTAQSPETQSRIAVLRARMGGQGEPVTMEEMREVIRLVRGDRVRASDTSAASRKRTAAKKGPEINADDLLGEM